jgi:hypothetical protein
MPYIQPSESALTTTDQKNSPAQDTPYAMTVPYNQKEMKKNDQRVSSQDQAIKGVKKKRTNKWAQGARLYDARVRALRRLGLPDASSGGRSIASMQIAQSPKGPPSVSGIGGW